MNLNFVFVDRRTNNRRQDTDPCKHLPLDLCHQKRRKSAERRTTESRTFDEHSEAFMQSALANWEPTHQSDDTPN